MYLMYLKGKLTCTCKSTKRREFDTCLGPGIWGWGGRSEEIFFLYQEFFKQSQTPQSFSIDFLFINRAKQVLGSCVRVAAVPREVFSRVLLLFTMNVIPDEEDTGNNGRAQQL